MIRSRQDKAIEVISYVVMTIIAVIVIYPFLLLFMSSITDESSLLINGYSIFPKKYSLYAYSYIWDSRSVILKSYLVTLVVTLIGTLMHVAIVALVSYPLSVSNLPGRRFFQLLFIFTMPSHGGLVPTYIFYTTIPGIKNSYVALVVPNLMFSAFNAIICKTYISNNIPVELLEAARIDGGSEFLIFRKIVLPLSKSIFVTIGIFAGLNYWNDWMNGLYYITDQSKYSIQQLLNVMVKNITYLSQYGHTSGSGISLPSISLRMAIAFVGMLPVIILYPFLQRYFESGITLGAVKG